jgi:hypothetical protein
VRAKIAAAPRRGAAPCKQDPDKLLRPGRRLPSFSCNSMKTNPFRRAVRAIPVAAMVLLGGCATDRVVQASTQNAEPLDKNSLLIFWKGGKYERTVETHDREMRGSAPPSVTQEDAILFSAKADLVKLDLQRHLIEKMSAGMPSYVTRDRGARNALRLELVKIAADTDGSRDVTITASVLKVPSAEVVWWRTVKISASRFNSDGAISDEVSSAIIGQMKASALIE